MIVHDNMSAVARIYRICLFEHGAVIPTVKLVKALTDAEAIALAREFNAAAHCEIWEEHRLVGEFAPAPLCMELPAAR